MLCASLPHPSSDLDVSQHSHLSSSAAPFVSPSMLGLLPSEVFKMSFYFISA
jgi:hypothetical protein